VPTAREISAKSLKPRGDSGAAGRIDKSERQLGYLMAFGELEKTAAAKH